MCRNFGLVGKRCCGDKEKRTGLSGLNDWPSKLFERQISFNYGYIFSGVYNSKCTVPV